MSRFVWINGGVFAKAQRAAAGSAFPARCLVFATGRRTLLGEEPGAARP